MDRITQESSVEDYAEWLREIGYTVNITDGLIDANNGEGTNFFAHLLPSKNLVFRVPFSIKSGVDEFSLLKEVNSMNNRALSGSFSVDEKYFTFLFSLIKPFGMGKEGFTIFVKYNLNLLGYMLEKSDATEFLE